jgi:UDP-galactopyranose mutase
MIYDYAIVGSGLFGSVFAYEATKVGKKVLVIDKRDHIGGNCFTKEVEGINVHQYGPHIWHTTNKRIHKYMCQFCEFNNFTLRTKVNYNDHIYSFPINLFTLHQLWGVITPEQAAEKLEEVKVPIENPSNLEEWILSQVGEEIYEIFIKGYTTKQWGREPSLLPSSIIRRLPIRLTYNDRFYPDEHIYEGIPIGGYTAIFEKMLAKSEVRLNEDFFDDKKIIERIAKNIIYTGPLDKFFNYNDGKLEYRSLRFEQAVYSGDFQGNAIVNYTSKNIPYTRIVEHKHFEFLKNDRTVITKEYPESYTGYNEPFYPVNDDENKKIAALYKDKSAKLKNYSFGGRLATYNYYDMHQVVASALSLAEKIL